jgi:hypothetical protein
VSFPLLYFFFCFRTLLFFSFFCICIYLFCTLSVFNASILFFLFLFLGFFITSPLNFSYFLFSLHCSCVSFFNALFCSVRYFIHASIHFSFTFLVSLSYFTFIIRTFFFLLSFYSSSSLSNSSPCLSLFFIPFVLNTIFRFYFKAEDIRFYSY